MRPTLRMLTIGSVLWAVVGAAVAFSALPQVNADARWFVAAGLGLTVAAGGFVRPPRTIRPV